MPIITDSKKIDEILTRGVAKIIEKKSLKKKLKSGRKLRIKLGIDPTGPKIHIGRACQFWKLRQFQELGHQIVLLFGDFTAQIGDASDKTSMRKPLRPEEIRQNMKTYRKQLGKILDLSKTEIHRNSEWADKLKVKELLPLAMKFTAQQMIQRRNFKERWDSNKPIGVHELLYPIMQGYDSLKIKADVEIGGTDQLFNLKVGREIQKMFNEPAQDIITLKMLYGLDGRKMSTSWGNVVNIVEPAAAMFGKIMSMKDELMPDYFELAARLPEKEVRELTKDLKANKVNPRDAKLCLAKEIVKLYYGLKQAEQAKQEFERVFCRKELPSEIPLFKTSKKVIPILELLRESGVARSKAEAKRLILQKGVKINGKTLDDWRKEIEIEQGMIVQAGTRKFVRISKTPPVIQHI